MSRPSFPLYLGIGVVAAGLVAWLPFQLGGIHGYQTPALILMLAWLGIFALAFTLYGRRAWWLLLASPPALFWLFILGGALICDGGRCG